MDIGDKIQLVVSYLLQIILLGGGIFSLLEKQWLNAFFMFGILILTFAPAVIRRNYKVFLPVEFDFVSIIFVFLAVFLGELQQYYYRFWWWDIILHTSSGFLIGIAGFLLVYLLNSERRIHSRMNPLFISLFAFAFALAFGALWEIFEFLMDQFFQINMQKGGLVDTMWDLIVDTIGAIVISALGYFYLKKGNFLIFDRMIHRFIDRNPRLFRHKKRK